MARLEEPHKAQIAEMLKDEKPWPEIIEYMKTTYGVKIKNHHIAYIKKTMNGGAAVPVKAKRKYHRRSAGVVKRQKSLVPGKMIHPVDAKDGLTEEQLKDMVFSGIQELSSRPRKLLLEINAEIEKIKLNIAKATGLAGFTASEISAIIANDVRSNGAVRAAMKAHSR